MPQIPPIIGLRPERNPEHNTCSYQTAESAPVRLKPMACAADQDGPNPHQK